MCQNNTPPIVVDFSSMGAGKTLASLALAERLKPRFLIVITGKSICSNWDTQYRAHKPIDSLSPSAGVGPIIMTYGALRSTRCSFVAAIEVAQRAASQRAASQIPHPLPIGTTVRVRLAHCLLAVRATLVPAPPSAEMEGDATEEDASEKPPPPEKPGPPVVPETTTETIEVVCRVRQTKVTFTIPDVVATAVPPAATPATPAATPATPDVVWQFHNEFEPTKCLRTMIEQGLLVIVDEAHTGKTCSSQTHQVLFAISRAMHEFYHLAAADTTSTTTPRRSAMIFLTGTPLDNSNDASSWLRLLRGVDDHGPPKPRLPTGDDPVFQELMDLIPHRSSRMDPPTMKTDIAILYVDLETDEEKKKLQVGLADLARACRNFAMHKSHAAAAAAVPRGDDCDDGGGHHHHPRPPPPQQPSCHVLTKALSAIEAVKVGGIARRTLAILASNPNAKAVIALNYLENIDTLVSRLQAAGLRVANVIGKTSATERSAIFDDFQNSSGTIRVIIGTLSVIGVGVSLDDTDGHFPRYAFFSATYNVTQAVQFMYRFARACTQSMPIVRIVYVDPVWYGASKHTERSIFEAMQRKRGVITAAVGAAGGSGTAAIEDYDYTFEHSPDVRHSVVAVADVAETKKKKTMALRRQVESAAIDQLDPPPPPKKRKKRKTDDE